jgi:3-oxoacyl-[acyl-carrier protein] reductase
VLAITVDVSKPGEIAAFIKQAASQFGRIDILVNNAGGPPFDKFENINEEQWLQAFNLNLMSVARASKLVLPYMQQTGSGRIINIISGSVKAVLAGSVLSTAMRMGVVGLAKMMADEFGPYNITVNNVAPGLILTDRIKHTLPKGADTEEAMKEKSQSIPLGRIGEPADHYFCIFAPLWEKIK